MSLHNYYFNTSCYHSFIIIGIHCFGMKVDKSMYLNYQVPSLLNLKRDQLVSLV
jgi:hypothetical protein